MGLRACLLVTLSCFTPAYLHDGAGEATALLQQGDACLCHVRRRGLLGSGRHPLVLGLT